MPTALSAIQPRDLIYAYEVPPGTDTTVQILLRKPAINNWSNPEKIAYPLVLGISAGCTNVELRRRVQTLGNSMLKAGQVERFRRMQVRGHIIDHARNNM